MSQVAARGALHVVATPIGNLEDLSPRAADILRSADLVLCEDTRHSGGLLRHLGSGARTLSLHAHNEHQRIETAIEQLRGGRLVALVSDAGTPCLSDPGNRLVDAVLSADLPVVSVPGPFAGAVALAGAGLTTASFSFWGFLPKKSAARRAALAERLNAGPGGELHTHVMYVPGRDVAPFCEDIAAVAPDCRVAVARELTKIHERYVRGTPSEVVAKWTDEWARGEAVVLVEVDGATCAQPVVAVDAETLVRQAIQAGEPRKAALRRIAKQTGKGRRELYATWQKMLDEAPAGPDQ